MKLFMAGGRLHLYLWEKRIALYPTHGGVQTFLYVRKGYKTIFSSEYNT